MRDDVPHTPVESLLNKSLVQASEETRFTMLETIREYALERLSESGQAEKIRRQHALCFLELAEAAAPNLTGAESARWAKQLQRDDANLDAALTWGLEPSDDQVVKSAKEKERVEIAARLASALWRYWYTYGDLRKGRAWLRQVRNAAETVSLPAPLTSKILSAAGILAWATLDLMEAQALLEKNLALCRELGDRSGIASALNNLGLVARDQFQFAQARELYAESLAQEQQLGEPRAIADSLVNLGIVVQDQGDTADAIRLYEEGLAIYRKLDNKLGIANTLNSLGSAVIANGGNHVRATALLEESLALAKELGVSYLLPHALNNLAKAAFYQGDCAGASALLEKSLALAREQQNKSGIVGAVFWLGRVALAQGNLERARAFVEEATMRYQAVPYRLGLAHCEVLAWLAAASQQPARAAMLFGAAESSRDAMGVLLPPSERVEHARYFGSARAQIDEAAFNAAHAEGRARSLEQAVALALK